MHSFYLIQIFCAQQLAKLPIVMALTMIYDISRNILCLGLIRSITGCIIIRW